MPHALSRSPEPDRPDLPLYGDRPVVNAPHFGYEIGPWPRTGAPGFRGGLRLPARANTVRVRQAGTVRQKVDRIPPEGGILRVAHGDALEIIHAPLRRIAWPPGRALRFQPIAAIALRPQNIEANEIYPARWRRQEDHFPGSDGNLVIVANRRSHRHMPDIHFLEIFQ